MGPQGALVGQLTLISNAKILFILNYFFFWSRSWDRRYPPVGHRAARQEATVDLVFVPTAGDASARGKAVLRLG